IHFKDRPFMGPIRLVGSLQQSGEYVRAEIHKHESGFDRLRMVAQLKVHGSSASGEIETFDANVCVHFSAVAGGDAGEFVHNASHPADRHFPLSGAIANEVIKKAA